MEENIEDLFLKEDVSFTYVNPDPDAANSNKKFSFAESVISSIEEEYKKPSERENHRQILNAKLTELTKKLKNTKNIKNHRLTSQNASIAEKRKKIRDEIAKIKDDIFAIDLEKEGSNVSSESLVDKTINETAFSSKKPAGHHAGITASNSNLGWSSELSSSIFKF